VGNIKAQQSSPPIKAVYVERIQVPPDQTVLNIADEFNLVPVA
jgi:hypothetical protein